MVSGAAFAAGGGMMGLFIDEARSSWCAEGVGFYPVEMWVWCLPGDEGQICAEFALAYPPNVIQSTVTKNVALISVDMGDLASGWSVCYIVCQYDWNWPAHQALWVTDPTETDVIIIAHPGVGTYQYANCAPGYPVEPFDVYCNLNINHCLVATEESSWGAIKNLISE
jgi:hypothetical protein